MESVCVLGHPWIVDDRVAPDKPLDSAVLSRLKQFSAMNKLKKMALRVCFFLHSFILFTYADACSRRMMMLVYKMEANGMHVLSK